MVSFNPIGRLGNILFEAAAAMSYADKYGLIFTMPKNIQYYPKLNRKSSFITRINNKVIKEKVMFKYNVLPYNKKWKNVILDGYFQNVMYFDWNKNKVLNTFCPNWTLNKGFVSVHVRRGDYLELTEKHPPVPKVWIERAMQMFNGYKFIFFSDDIEWCKQEFGMRDDCSFSGKSELEDLLDIANCEHHINSSSTFSWWGAYLNRNPNKIVVTPARWMTDKHSNEWTQSIIPNEWIKLEYNGA